MDQVNFFHNFVNSFGLNLTSQRQNHFYNNNQFYSSLQIPSYESPAQQIYQTELLRDDSSMLEKEARRETIKKMTTNSEAAEKKSKQSQYPIQIENKRVRNMFSEKQIEILERAFEQTHYPDLGMREELSRMLNLKPLRIQVWFQNRRAKYRKLDYYSKTNPKNTNN